MKSNKFYSGKKVLSYGTPFIFSLGNRSTGKTFYWTDRNINRFLEGGHKFIYVRRYDEDLKRVAPTYFNANAFKHPDVEFEVRGNGKSGTQLLINKEVAGITIALSLANKFKSVSLPDFDTIVFDEFLPEDGQYLPTEVSNALSLYQTVARGNGKSIREDVKFIFIANNVTLNNPYFRELKIRDRIQLDTEYSVDSDRAWVVELFNNAVIGNEIASTAFGKMISKTKYGEYAIKSQFYLDDDTFIQKPSGNSRYYCTLIYNDSSYGVYEYTDESLFYISNKTDPNCKAVYALTTKDHRPNYLLLNRNKYNPLFDMLRFAYDNALLRFESADAKWMFLDFMQIVIKV